MNKIDWARYQAWYYIEIGLKCEKCSSSKNLVRHHPDYNKPLEIITLCRKCHAKASHNSIIESDEKTKKLEKNYPIVFSDQDMVNRYLSALEKYY
jgi:hypothetical protein